MEFEIYGKKIQAVKSNKYGFMFKTDNTPLYFEDINPKTHIIHMLFVFKKLNIYFLDKDKKIIINKKLYPFVSFSKIPNQTSYILEIPSKVILE